MVSVYATGWDQECVMLISSMYCSSCSVAEYMSCAPLQPTTAALSD